MKQLLLTALLLVTKPQNAMQILVYNTSTSLMYVLDTADDQFTLIPIQDENYVPIACMNNEMKRLKDVDFSHAPDCLIKSLNQNMNLHIQEYINLNNKTSPETIKKLIQEKNLTDLVAFYRTITTSFTLMDVYQNVQRYKNVPMTYTTQYPFLLQVADGYIALFQIKNVTAK